MSKRTPILSTFLAVLVLAAPPVPGASAKTKGWFCAQPWGWVSGDGRIVAADVPGASAPVLVFGKPVLKAYPPYPTTAVAARATGTVVIVAHVSASGQIVTAEVRFGARSDLDEAALRSAQGWRFSATTADGAPVSAFAQIVFKFSVA